MKYGTFNQQLLLVDGSGNVHNIATVREGEIARANDLAHTANFVTEALPAVNRRHAELMRRAASMLTDFGRHSQSDIARMIDELDSEAEEMED
jgi:hypothetical protein